VVLKRSAGALYDRIGAPTAVTLSEKGLTGRWSRYGFVVNLFFKKMY
jgi:hypothetical protein